MPSDDPSKHSRHVWDRAWTSYAEPPANHHEPLIDATQRALGSVEDARILEIGAGSARDSLRLAELGARVVAVDNSAPAIELTRKGMVTRGVELALVQADVFRLPFNSGSFDLVFSQGVMGHFADPRPLLDEQVRVLRPGGALLMDLPQTVNVYTVRNKLLMRSGRWFAGWETSYTLPRLERLLQNAGQTIVDSYGSGYFPRQALALRNAHTFDQRHDLPVKLPTRVRASVEAGWQWLERRRSYYRWMWNIGVVARK